MTSSPVNRRDRGAVRWRAMATGALAALWVPLTSVLLTCGEADTGPPEPPASEADAGQADGPDPGPVDGDADAADPLPPPPTSGGPYSSWVYPGPDGRLVYKKDERGNQVPDFSYAGYLGGGVALPSVPVVQTLS